MIQLLSSGGLGAVVDDTTPVLGGDLDGGGFNISNVGTGTFDKLVVATTTLVTKNGYVGIGTDDPALNLEIRAGAGQLSAFRLEGQYGRFQMVARGGAVDVIYENLRPLATSKGYFKYTHEGVADRWSIGIEKSPNADLHFRSGGDAGPIRMIMRGDGKIALGDQVPTARLDIDSDILRLRTAKTPASAGASGNQGDIGWDSGFVYVCVAASTWRRAELLSW